MQKPGLESEHPSRMFGHGPHSVQAVAFVAAWNWPDGQAVQLLLAEEGWNLPAEQTVHVLAPRPLNVPGPQLVHAAWLSDAVN